MIRITGGEFRSRLLKTPNTDATKPTMDKVRQGVFSALLNEVNSASVLDLFAGSGSYGFEALSRGAKEVTFVDNGFEQVNVIKDNARALNVQVNIEKCDSLLFLNNCTKTYDLIFADPPYKLDVYNKIIDIVLEKHLLKDNGVLILESENDLTFDETKFKKVKIYKYSLAKVYVLRK